MNEHERQAILASLEHGSTALLNALHGVTEELAIRVPGPGRWSILQCAEHVAVAEDHLFSLITASKWSDTPLINEQREILIATRGPDRTTRRESPEDAKPTGRFSTLSEAVQHFQTGRVRTIQFVNENKGDLRSRITTHPLMGTVNCHEVLLLMAVHPTRHANQIEEIKAAATS
ncbi:MAG: DinB family protein [Terracidiphilus sp.]